MGATSGSKGYYKYTDIFFEWHKSLPNQEDVSALRATLSSISLVHPDHPLRKPGQNGIALYLVTRKSTGQQRLAFSYEQIEYIQYWLHAMGLTETRIPLPHSDHLIRGEEIYGIAAEQVFTTAKAVQAANKNAEKASKKLKGGLPQLRAITFECVRTLWRAESGTWLAIDFEAWEFEHDMLTEFGYNLVRWEDGQLKEERGHWIVEEWRPYRNGKYVPDKRDFYDFGTSEVMTKAVFRDRINGMIEKYSSEGPLYLVFHDAPGDIKYLRSKMIQNPLPGLSFTLPNQPPEEGIFAVDTSELFAALEGVQDKRSLKSITTMLKVHNNASIANLHNAGNDAHLTMLCLRDMAEGDTLRYQQEKRWPGQTSKTSSQVEYTAWDDPDLSDEPFVEDVPFLEDDRSMDW